jgi:hypothetical protein
VRRIGAALNGCLATTDAYSRGIALFGLGALAIQLHKLGIINIGAKDILNCVQISLVRVAGKLHAIGETRCQIINEQLGCVAVATADEP